MIGIDKKPQKNYPFPFIQADALQPPVDLADFDFIWASPPCQKYTAMKTMPKARQHADLIPATRDMLEKSGRLFCIENVEGAPLRVDLLLCGTMFNLGYETSELRRHRIFELNFFIMRPGCQHISKPQNGRPATVGVWGNAGGSSKRDGVKQFSTEERKIAMGIDWMTGAELSEAIPPAYSEFIGREAIKHITSQAA